MVILDGNKRFFYIRLPQGTRAYGNMPDLHACVAMLEAAQRAGCEGFVVQEPGQRSRQYSLAEVQTHYRKDPITLRGARGMGRVVGGEALGMVNVGGQHVTIRKMKKTGGGLVIPA